MWRRFIIKQFGNLPVKVQTNNVIGSFFVTTSIHIKNFTTSWKIQLFKKTYRNRTFARPDFYARTPHSYYLWTDHSTSQHFRATFAVSARKLRANNQLKHSALMRYFLTTFNSIPHRQSSPRRKESLHFKKKRVPATSRGGPCTLSLSSFGAKQIKLRGGVKREKEVTHQLIENRYVVGVRQKRSVALRCRGERRSIHSGEDVGERAGRTELCPGPGIAGDPLALRRVYRSDVLISQLRERHGGVGEGEKLCCDLTKQGELPRYPLLQCEHVSNKRCKQREVYISSGTASVNDPVAPLISPSSSSLHPHFPIDLDGLRSGPYRLLQIIGTPLLRLTFLVV